MRVVLRSLDLFWRPLNASRAPIFELAESVDENYHAPEKIFLSLRREVEPLLAHQSTERDSMKGPALEMVEKAEG
jgi:hypothetical protein